MEIKIMTYLEIIQEEIKRLNSGNACYLLVQNLPSFHLLSKKLKIRIYKAIILSGVLYGCETWFLTLFENSIREQGAQKNIWQIFDKRVEKTA
jgi:hypothetical protein